MISFQILPPHFYIEYGTAAIKFVKITGVTTNSNVACKEDVVLAKVAMIYFNLLSTNSFTRFGITSSTMDFNSLFDISDASERVVATLSVDVNNVFTMTFQNISIFFDYKMS